MGNEKPGGAGMGGAALKPLLHLARRDPVACAVGMTKDKQGVVLLHRRAKPRKLMAELLGAGAGAGLDRTSLRFGRAHVDGGSDSTTVHFTVNKAAPGALRMALTGTLRQAGSARRYLSVNRLAIHHATDTCVQLIPSQLNALIPHIGSAADLRLQKRDGTGP